MTTGRIYIIALWLALAALPLAFIFNLELFRYFNCTKNGSWQNWFFLTLTSLADGLWVVMIATVMQSLRPRNFGVFLLALVIGSLFLHTGKFFMDADRPLRLLGEQAVCVLGQPVTVRSFPSGHSFSAILLLIFLRPRHSALAALLALSLGVAAAISRVNVGAHFPRDIVAGGLIAVAAFYLAERLAPRMQLWNLSENARAIGLFIVGAGSAVIYIFAYHEKTPELEFVLTPCSYVVLAYWVTYATRWGFRALR